MKQHITENQWDELSEGEKILWIKFFQLQSKHPVLPCNEDFQEFFPNIGQMIEFLGGGVTIQNSTESVVLVDLCDALWEAVKHKIINVK